MYFSPGKLTATRCEWIEEPQISIVENANKFSQGSSENQWSKNFN